MARPSVQQVEALAPDRSSVAAARKLATPGPWSGAGHDDRAAWGACRGSGKAPYAVACDTWGPGYRCSCPSRKFPCKHALALLLLWAESSPAVPGGTPPADVGAWLAGRAAKAAGPAPLPEPGEDVADAERAGAPAPAAPADPEAAAARAARRSGRIAAGMEELRRWLGDLVDHGLGWAQSQPYGYWDAMGARLVDAQAPGAASRVRRLAGVVRSGEGWPGRLLGQVGRLNLLAAGWGRLEALPEPVRADLRTAAGWPWPSEEVLASRRERDRWYVLARAVTEEERVRAQRTWLWGLDTGRLGVVVDFARPGAAFAWELWPGNVLDAEVARFPGSAPLRVLVAAQHGEPAPGGPPPAWPDLGAVAAARGATLAADPWCDRWPVSLAGAVPDGRPGRWTVRDEGGRRLPMAVEDDAAWRLLAVSAGHPVTLAGEWDGDRLRPLGAWAHDRMVVL
ncbi:MAG TPA: SWIM zinc finger family protein [Acidimicrobiales bacterium]|nr:SWIM zinc finger family protein [Acidimicrobiales bacterium]